MRNADFDDKIKCEKRENVFFKRKEIKNLTRRVFEDTIDNRKFSFKSPRGLTKNVNLGTLLKRAKVFKSEVDIDVLDALGKRVEAKQN